MDVSRRYMNTNISSMLGEGSGHRVDRLCKLAGIQEASETPFFCTSALANGGRMSAGPVPHATLNRAAARQQQFASIEFPDAIHLTAAIGFSCSRFPTANKRMPRRIELMHTRPGIGRGPAPVDLIEPGVENVQLIIEQQTP